MRCSITFKVDSCIKLAFSPPIPRNEWKYQFQTGDHGFIESLQISFPVTNRDEWPFVRPDPRPGVKLSIERAVPSIVSFAQQDAIAIMCVMGPFGIRTIDVDNYKANWIPENEEESKLLQLYSFSVSKDPVSKDKLSGATFDLVARSVLALPANSEIVLLGSLFRRIQARIIEHEYLDAIRYSYFVLESLFSEGEWRNRAMKQKLSASAHLREAWNTSIKEDCLLAHEFKMHDSAQYAAYLDHLKNKGFESTVSEIVDTRGKIQHLLTTTSGLWHPERQQTWKHMAWFLQSIAFQLFFTKIRELLWSEPVLKAYESLRRTHSSEFTYYQERNP